MAKDKKSFILYSDLIHTVKKMPADKAGELFLTILQYVNDENPKVDDMVIDLVFEPIKQQLKRDLKKYEDKRIQQSEAGKRSAELRKLKKDQRTLTDVKERATDSTVNVNDSVNDNDIFKIFWDSYHNITKKQKTDKVPAIKYFKKLTLKEQDIAIDKIKQYSDSVTESRYRKKAYKYLRDKNFNDEFTTKNNYTHVLYQYHGLEETILSIEKYEKIKDRIDHSTLVKGPEYITK